jgi:hypothetical protein
MKIKKNTDITKHLKKSREEISLPVDTLKSRLYNDIPGEFQQVKLIKRKKIKLQFAAAFVFIFILAALFVINQQESPEFPEDYFKPTIVISLIDEEPLEDTFTPTRIVKITEDDLIVIKEDQKNENHDI